VVGDRLRPITAADLEAQQQPLACLITELPIREAGGQLPTWDELEALKALARERNVALHMDGARLWESRAFYDRSYAEICAGFASVYVSAYKGLGGIAGAVLAGDEDFIGEARLWRKRMGGTLVHQSPMIASAAMRLDGRLAMMDALYARAMSLAEALGAVPGIRVNPAKPHTNMMHLYLEASADTVLDRRDAIAARDGVWLIGGAQAAEVPGWCVSELYVGDSLLDHDNDEVVRRLRELLG
jgi:threonine aldolase